MLFSISLPNLQSSHSLLHATRAKPLFSVDTRIGIESVLPVWTGMSNMFSVLFSPEFSVLTFDEVMVDVLAVSVAISNAYTHDFE